jgi:hypothetical protein
MFTEALHGLGITVVQTTKFDPTRVNARYLYWRNVLAQEVAQKYRDAGFLDGLGAAKFTPGMLQAGKIPILGNILNIASKIPIIGGMFCGIFGGCDIPHIPWGEIYAMVEPYARDYAKQEEEARIAEEQRGIQVQHTTAIEKQSAQAATFKLPEGVTSITRGALVMGTKSAPVEVRK